jgi:hypothetical protein
MPSNKLTSRRSVPVAPHICHPPPPPGAPPPVGTFWVAPLEQWAQKDVEAYGSAFAQSPDYPPDFYFNADLDIPHGYVEWSGTFKQGETCLWTWHHLGYEGDYVLTFWVKAGETLLATRDCIVHVEDIPA